MILVTAVSKNNVTIRLTDERWQHIILSHKEISPDHYSVITEAIENPSCGDFGELLAVQKVPRKEAWTVVVYKEVDVADGFVITAYITSDSRWLFQREILWSKE